MTMTYPEKMEIIKGHQDSAPVQTVPLAKDLGIRVWHVPNWPDNLSGKIMQSEKMGGSSGYAIYVNGSHHVNRRRFTTAHEIAHFVLHEDYIGDGITDDALYRSRLSNRREWDANKLAADVLIPWALLNPMIRSGVTSVGDLASRFQVSESAISVRLGTPT